MPRFSGKQTDVGVPVTIDRDRYIEGDTHAILEGTVILGEKPGSTVFPIQIDTDGYLKICFNEDITLQTKYEDDALSDVSRGMLIMGNDGANLQNISVDATGYLQAEVVTGNYNDIKYQDGAVVGSPYGTVVMGHDGSNVFPVVVGSDGYLQITRVEAIFSNSIADVTLVATSTTQIVGALVTRLCTLISNKRTNTQTFRIGDSNVGASRGAELAPGESISIETNGAIYGYNPGATESILVLLREEDDNPEPPAVPILTSPIGGIVIENTSVTFQWESSLGATNYQIRVSTDPGVETDLFHDDETAGATSKNYIDFPNDGTVYYWKVRAYNDVGWGNWSTVENFINGIVEEPPAAPILIFPTNGSTVSGTSITLQWESSVGATDYQIRVSTDPNVEANLFHEDITGGATSKNYNDFPDNGTTYYWKVRAYNDVGWSSWSTIWNFVNDNDGVPIVESGHVGFYDIGAGQKQYFKFVSDVPTCSDSIQVSNTPESPYAVHLLVKRSDKPTIAEFEMTWEMAPSDYDCDLEQWIPAKPGAEDLYWKYNIGSQAELVRIGEPMGSYTFYIMLYNNGAQTINTRLTVHYNV